MINIFDSINNGFGMLNKYIAEVLFFDIWPGSYSVPLAVAWLITGATFFTLRFKFINLRYFKHAIQIVRGKYDDKTNPGDVSHFQALTAALSATVGLGNIAGVGVAIGTGGPGAAFWMIVAGFLGMSSKFVECTLGVMYRKFDSEGRVLGGPMEYLSRGFSEKGFPRVGKFLAILFSIMCIGGSLGGGNAFQVNQSLNALKGSLPFFADYPWVYGLIMTLMTGIVIIGGICRIAKITEKIVPFMCGLYVLSALYILFTFWTEIPHMLAIIVKEAFEPDAMYGGALGVLVTGFRRAAFSNEAGVGSASIAHSAARTKVPVREGFVALLEPFIDTVIICTMTALVLIVTGTYNAPETIELAQTNQGAALTAAAFGSVSSWFPHMISLVVVLFAYSTMISWSYYGERCWAYIFGDGVSLYYKILFLMFTFFGSITTATNILDFSDLMILAMAFPNMIGLYLLSGKVAQAVRDYRAQ